MFTILRVSPHPNYHHATRRRPTRTGTNRGTRPTGLNGNDDGTPTVVVCRLPGNQGGHQLPWGMVLTDTKQAPGKTRYWPNPDTGEQVVERPKRNGMSVQAAMTGLATGQGIKCPVASRGNQIARPGRFELE